MREKKGLILGLISFTVIGVLIAGIFLYNATKPINIPNQLIFNTIDGKTQTFKHYKGINGTVVIFTATWCTYCKDEIKKAKPLYEKYLAKGIQFLMIFQDYDVGTIHNYRKANKIPWPVVQKTDYVMEIFRRKGTGVPSAYFISQNGDVIANLAGKNSTEHYPEVIERLLQDAN